ncbi:MAG: prolyl oligopeptidase family serine peptidase [Bryobacteraceae bacterium]
MQLQYPLAIGVAAVFCTGALLAVEAITYPATPKRPVTDEYYGVKIVDDYRWLDDGSSAETKKWSAAENKVARHYLDSLKLRPDADSWLTAMYSKVPPSYGEPDYRGGRLFAIKFEPPKPQKFLVSMPSADDPEKATVIVDPNVIDPSGGTSIDWYTPSHDGKLVAVSLSKGGSEDGSLYVYETATGKHIDEVIPRVQFPTGGGSVAWNGDASGFWYTRYPAPGEKPPADQHFFEQVWFHKLGTPVKQDVYAVGKEFPRIAEANLQSSSDGKYVLATVANGDGGDYFHFLYAKGGRWHQITRFSDRASKAQFAPNGDLYVLTKLGTPLGRIVRLAAPDFPLASAKTVVTAATASIDDFLVAGSMLYVSYMAGGPSKLRAVKATDGTGGKMLDIKMISAVGHLTGSAGDDLLFTDTTFTEPASYYRYQPATEQVTKTALALPSPVSFDDIETLRVMVTSKDGSKVPLNILRRKGTKLDGNNPTLLYGYGGYSISLAPQFNPSRRWWFDHGGVYAVANLRGGGEFGEPWHEAGKLTKKQNVFDDFIACAEYLIKAKYTSPAKLAIEGGSNGGLLMGAALTQRPDLFRAVVAHVGIYDMLRVELFPNGAFNVTEFGTVKEKDQFQALYAYSPYHHVKDGEWYPAVLFLTGENDGRVDPANSRKMTARLQAAQKGPNPILLRTSSGSGHGMGTALGEKVAQEADVFAFLAEQLGMK